MTAEERISMQDARWMLVTYHEDDPGKPQVGVAADGVVYRAPELLAGRSMLEILADYAVTKALKSGAIASDANVQLQLPHG